MIGNFVEDSIHYINKMDNVTIEIYVIMPDHIHMIVELDEVVSAEKGRGGTLPLHRVIGGFKSYTTKQFNVWNGTVGMKLWQRNYYEHIIRNEYEYDKICQYIKNNPINYIRKHNSNL